MEVRHVPERRRYELIDDGRAIGFADAIEQGETITIPHVEVSPELNGRGYGSLLMKGVVEDAQRRGKRIQPICGFAAAYLRRHSLM